MLHAKQSSQDTSRVGILKIAFKGNLYLSEQKLRREISLKDGRHEWLDTLIILHDREKLIAVYSEQGFPDAEIRWSANVDSSARATTVLFQIKERERQFVQSLTLSGNQALNVEEIREVVELREGRPFDPRKVGQDEYLIHLACANRGYAFAKVDHEVLRDSLGHVHLVYRLEEGPKVFLGGISLEGNEKTNGKFLLAQSGIRPGQVFSLERLGKAQQTLLGTGLLQEASFVPSGLTPEGKIDLTLEVKEKSSRWVSAGLGYGASDQFRISGEWGHRNLWGLGKRITLRSYGGFALAPKVRDVIARSEISLGDPFLFSTLFRGSLSGYYEHDAPSSGAYQAQRWGCTMSLEREWVWPGVVSGESRYEKVVLSDTFALSLPDSLRFRTTRSLGLRLRKDLRNPFRKLVRGLFLRFSEEYAGGIFGGDNNFVRTQGGVNAYLPVIGSVTLAGKMEGGSVENLPDERAVPIYERFFLGGASSLRGYPEKGLSPEDSTGRLLGGHRYLLGSLEIRARIDRYWGGALFSDVGNVWLAEDRLTHKALRSSAGTELHYYTPVGPIRAGFAVKIRPEPGKPKGAYYLASGFAF
jgi:outer membrane protein assembly complex protein YaeT